MASPEEVVEQLRELFPGAQIVTQSLGGTVGAVTSQESDRLARLERLAKLKESGALTDEEFEAEKARILDQS